jgi:hypothetical protein
LEVTQSIPEDYGFDAKRVIVVKKLLPFVTRNHLVDFLQPAKVSIGVGPSYAYKVR